MLLDEFPRTDNFVETEWANWNTILRIEVTSESPESDCGAGLDCVSNAGLNPMKLRGTSRY